VRPVDAQGPFLSPLSPLYSPLALVGLLQGELLAVLRYGDPILATPKEMDEEVLKMSHALRIMRSDLSAIYH
jgi:hypothetical protein